MGEKTGVARQDHDNELSAILLADRTPTTIPYPQTLLRSTLAGPVAPGGIARQLLLVSGLKNPSYPVRVTLWRQTASTCIQCKSPHKAENTFHVLRRKRV